MALQLNDRVKESSITTGVVPIVLSGASIGYQTVASSISTSNTFPYVIELPGTSEWEIGIGQYNSSNNSIIRTQIINSSSNGVIVDFSAGQKNVFVSIPAAYSALTAKGLSQFSTTTSAELAEIISDETGSGKLVFSNNAVLVSPNIGVANGTSLTLTGNLSVSGSNVVLGNISNVHVYGGSVDQFVVTDGAGNLSFIDYPTPNTVVYLANSIIQTNGVYVSGNLASVQTFGDYSSNTGSYTLTDGSGSAPAWEVDFDFLGVSRFNRVVMSINYTQSSGHTVYVQLYNVTNSTWDSIGTYTGLGSYYGFALDVIDYTNYVSTGRVQLRLYHSNAGNTAHTTNIDYVSLEQSYQGPQGPKGTTGATGPAGQGIATGGTSGQVLIKNSGTNYDTAWANTLTSFTFDGFTNFSIVNNAPFSVVSNTTVSNLNADLLDGQHGTYYTDLSSSAFNQANAAFTQANTGVTVGQGAFTQANTGVIVGQGAFSQANAAFTQANTGVTVGQGAFAQANIAYNTANTKFSANGGTIFGSVTITTDLSVTGNVYLGGNVTTLSSNNLSVSDSLIYMAQDNPANINDIGIVGHFTSNNYQHTGFVRDASDGVWKLFSNVSSEPTTTINFSNTTIYDPLQVGSVITSNAVFSIANGTAPFSVVSTTNIPNLNADLLDGQHGTYYTDLSSSAFTQANTGVTVGQGAFLAANTGVTVGQGAFAQANTGVTVGQGAFAQANAAFTQANTGVTVGQEAFAQANTGVTVGQAAFTQANAAISVAPGNTGNVLTSTGNGWISSVLFSYTLPTANTTTLGGVKVDGTTITANNGVISGAALTKTISNKTSAYTVVSSDLGSIINCTANSFTVSLTAAATLGSGFTCTIWNTSSASTDAITIDPYLTETIDGVATLILRRGEGMDIVCNGTNWQTSYKKVMRGYAENLPTNVVRPIASGAGSISLGDSSVSSGISCFSAGYTAVASGNYSLALGATANSFAQYSLALGAASVSSGLYSSAIGMNSSGGGAKAVTGTGAMALQGSYASGTDSFAVAIGNNTSSYGAQGANAIAIGRLAYASSANSVAIGSGSGGGAKAAGSGAIALGESYATGTNSFAAAIGNNTVSFGAQDHNSIAIGRLAYAASSNSVAIGSGSAGVGAVAVGLGGIALGSSYAGGRDSFAAAIADNTSSYGATGANAIAMGNQARASGANTVAIGSGLGGGAKALGTESIALGSSLSMSYGSFSAAIGTNTGVGAWGDCAIAIGRLTYAASSNSVAIGSGSTGVGAWAVNLGAIALGASYAGGRDSFAAAIADNTSSFGATGENSIAIGRLAYASGANTVAIGSGSNGQGAVAAAQGAIALGASYSTGVESFAAVIGNNTSTYGATGGNQNNIAIGYLAKASGGYSVAIGQGAVAVGSFSLALGTGSGVSSTYATAIGVNSGGSGAQAITGLGAMALQGSYASGRDSFAAAIGNNTSSYGATGDNSIAIGRLALASSANSVAIGSSSQAIGNYSFAAGSNCQANGQSSVALGYYSIAREAGKYAFSGTANLVVGDSQFGKIVLATASTQTATVLTSNITTAGSTNQLVVQTNGAMTFFGTLIAKQTASANMASYAFKGAIVNNAGTVTISTISIDTIVDTIGLTTQPTFTADNTNKCLAVTSGAKTATGVRWVCNIDSVEVIFA